MKTLIVLAHPDIENARVNKRWKDELLKYPSEFEIHELYKAYPDGEIDIRKEQNKLLKYENIIYQFPIYWYSYPPLLKKWFDEVFTHGWAYGSKGDKLKNKNMGVAVSIGDKSYNYKHSGSITFTAEEILAPFKATTIHIGAKCLPYHLIYGSSFQATDEEIDKNAEEYAAFLKSL